MISAPVQRVACAALLVWCHATGPSAAQRVAPAPAGSPGDASRPAGFVLGQVVDAESGSPIPNATVLLAPGIAAATSPTRATLGVLSDGLGRFLFRNLARGLYVFTATAPGYLNGGYGQRRSDGTPQPFALEEGQRAGNVTIRLWKEAALSGTVVDELGAPVPGVTVNLLRKHTASGRTRLSIATYGGRTDDQGAYRFAGLEAGDYLVSLPARMTQMPLSVADAGSDTLQALRATGAYSMSMGLTAMNPSVVIPGFAIQTNGQGNVGGSNELTGRLPVSVRADGRLVGYPTTFYTNATAATDATVVSLRPGDDRSNVDLHLRPAALVPLSGVVAGPTGPESNFAVHLVPAYAASAGGDLERFHVTAVTATDPSGAFRFAGVPAGQYVLKAWRLPPVLSIGRDPLPPDTSLWGETPVSIGESAVAGVAITVQRGVTLTGRVEFDGTAPVPTPQQIQTMLSACFEFPSRLVLGNLLATRVTAPGDFVTQGLPPGKHFVIWSDRFSLASSGWHFESATLDGADLLITPLVLESGNLGPIIIKMSDRRTELSGTVTGTNGRPDPQASVIVFPADYRGWIKNGLSPYAARVVPASQTGTFAIRSLPAGEFLVAAADGARLSNWEASTIEALAPLATRVTIARGDVKQQDLTTRTIR